MKKVFNFLLNQNTPKGATYLQAIILIVIATVLLSYVSIEIISLIRGEKR